MSDTLMSPAGFPQPSLPASRAPRRVLGAAAPGDDEPTIRMTAAAIRRCQARSAGSATGLVVALRAMLQAMLTRRSLEGLDDRMLKDIGLSRVDALAEAGRRPWDLGPYHQR